MVVPHMDAELARAVAAELAGRTEVVSTETYSDAGVAFAGRHGLEIGIREVRQLLDLPVDADVLASTTSPTEGLPFRRSSPLACRVESSSSSTTCRACSS